MAGKVEVFLTEKRKGVVYPVTKPNCHNSCCECLVIVITFMNDRGNIGDEFIQRISCAIPNSDSSIPLYNIIFREIFFTQQEQVLAFWKQAALQ